MIKGYSVITNFGCRFSCPYCIWKDHPLKDSRDGTDWNALNCFLHDAQDSQVGKVSVSGGGDPFFKLENNQVWWEKFLSLTTARELEVSVHTRERVTLDNDVLRFLLNHISRLTLSTDVLDDVLDYAYMMSRYTQIRVVHVVQPFDTMKSLDKYVLAFFGTPIQLSFKQLHQSTDNTLFNKAKDEYRDDVFFIEDKDYNYYFMPDNKVYEHFVL